MQQISELGRVKKVSFRTHELSESMNSSRYAQTLEDSLQRTTGELKNARRDAEINGNALKVARDDNSRLQEIADELTENLQDCKDKHASAIRNGQEQEENARSELTRLREDVQFLTDDIGRYNIALGKLGEESLQHKVRSGLTLLFDPC